MSTRVNDWALTEKEKQTLRLIVRGHDAKSTARSLGLSVHTINERLRDARRKMAVSSSREAARLLLEAEGGLVSPPPHSLGDTGIGADSIRPAIDQGDGRAFRPLPIIIGVLAMIALGLFALLALPQLDSPPASAPAAAEAAVIPEVVDAARKALVLGDQGRWDDAYQLTGASFHKMNSPEAWRAACEKVRAPLGAMTSRTFLSEQYLPAPPYGYEVVKFRTSFANKADAIETVTLNREDGVWRVVGVTIE